MPGQAHDLRETAEIIEGISCKMFLTDRAFDANWLRENLSVSGIIPVIPPKSNRKIPSEFDNHSYKWRHLIENYFQKLKEFKRIALRACIWPPLSSILDESQQALARHRKRGIPVVPWRYLRCQFFAQLRHYCFS